ncbi:E3 ubiquitin-protein ligase RBBP6 isoform X2 [Schistocerca nitens]|uniref:E3 ubiquitin-protein ligase RBBP6 isoform X2 n=1 Tax=Schistocerca nitens TaxID=7011 RepID=UPI0021178496|nr:E3 ubiquitin-protein ligase RBBP6 isoform X2 [Schistocerca nitens]
MSVHYKFKSALEYDTVTFDGLHISVRDLKKAILHQKRIGKNTDFDLQITNAQTKEVYVDESALIPKNTSLIVARVPLTAQQKKAWDRAEAAQPLPALTKVIEPLTDGQDPGVSKLAKAVDLSSLDASEEDKIQAMMTQSTQDYNPSNYMKIRGANQMGEVPSNYRCYKCHQPGHWIKNCPLGTNLEPIEIKKSTGIPRSFMVPVEGPSVPGAMMTPTGHFAVPAIDHQAYKEGKKEKPPFQHEPEPIVQKPEIPEDLQCSVCKDLLTDAVMIPCCGNSFCDECIRTVLLESEEHECPDCKEKDVSPDTLIPNRFLRTAVNNFKNATGYNKINSNLRPLAPHRPPPNLQPMKPPLVAVQTSSSSPSVETMGQAVPVIGGIPQSSLQQEPPPDFTSAASDSHESTLEDAAPQTVTGALIVVQTCEATSTIPVLGATTQESSTSAEQRTHSVREPIVHTETTQPLARPEIPIQRPVTTTSVTGAVTAESRHRSASVQPSVTPVTSLEGQQSCVHDANAGSVIAAESGAQAIPSTIAPLSSKPKSTSQHQVLETIPTASASKSRYPSSQRRSVEERPGTPTIDEHTSETTTHPPAAALPDTSVPPPNFPPGEEQPQSTSTQQPPTNYSHIQTVGSRTRGPSVFRPDHPFPPQHRLGGQTVEHMHPRLMPVPTSDHSRNFHSRPPHVSQPAPAGGFPPRVPPPNFEHGSAPFPHESGSRTSHYEVDRDGPPVGRGGYRGFNRGRGRMMHGYRGGHLHHQPPPPGLGRNVHNGNQAGAIEDPLEAFERMLREKDDRDRKLRKTRRPSRSRSRSFTPRSRSTSTRSYTRSRSHSRTPHSPRSRTPRSRTPRSRTPRKRSRTRTRTRTRTRSRTRSRSFTISRSRSRSFSRSPTPRVHSPRERDFSPRRKGSSRYRTPTRSPARYQRQFKDARTDFEAAPYFEGDYQYGTSGSRGRGGRFGQRKDFNKDYFDQNYSRFGSDNRFPEPASTREVHHRIEPLHTVPANITRFSAQANYRRYDRYPDVAPPGTETELPTLVSFDKPQQRYDRGYERQPGYDNRQPPEEFLTPPGVDHRQPEPMNYIGSTRDRDTTGNREREVIPPGVRERDVLPVTRDINNTVTREREIPGTNVRNRDRDFAVRDRDWDVRKRDNEVPVVRDSIRTVREQDVNDRTRDKDRDNNDRERVHDRDYYEADHHRFYDYKSFAYNSPDTKKRRQSSSPLRHGGSRERYSSGERHHKHGRNGSHGNRRRNMQRDGGKENHHSSQQPLSALDVTREREKDREKDQRERVLVEVRKEPSVEQERVEKERVEKERIERERVEKDRVEKDRAEKSRIEKDRIRKEDKTKREEDKDKEKKSKEKKKKKKEKDGDGDRKKKKKQKEKRDIRKEGIEGGKGQQKVKYVTERPIKVVHKPEHEIQENSELSESHTPEKPCPVLLSKPQPVEEKSKPLPISTVITDKAKGVLLRSFDAPASSTIIDGLYADIDDARIDDTVVARYGKVIPNVKVLSEAVETSTEVAEACEVTENEANEVQTGENVKDDDSDAIKKEETESESKAMSSLDTDQTTETRPNVMLAPLPEPSKWELDEEIPSQTYEDKSGDERISNSASSEKSGKIVTSEVLKRAENAIFQKAINAIRPIEPMKKLPAERKVYSATDKDKRISGDTAISELIDDKRKLMEKDAREARKTANSIQITIPIAGHTERSVEVSPVQSVANISKSKTKLDRSKFASTSSWGEGNENTSPQRISAKERLGARVDSEITKSKEDGRDKERHDVLQQGSYSDKDDRRRKLLRNRSRSDSREKERISKHTSRKGLKSAVERRRTISRSRSRTPHMKLQPIDRGRELKDMSRYPDILDRRYEVPVDLRDRKHSDTIDLRRKYGDVDSRSRRERETRELRYVDNDRERRYVESTKRTDTREQRDRRNVTPEKRRERSLSREKRSEKFKQREEREKEKSVEGGKAKHKTKRKGKTRRSGSESRNRKKSVFDRELKRSKKREKKHKKEKVKKHKQKVEKEEKKDEDESIVDKEPLRETDPLASKDFKANPSNESEMQQEEENLKTTSNTNNSKTDTVSEVTKDKARKGLRRNPRLASDRKKSTLDEANFEPDYDASSSAESDADETVEMEKRGETDRKSASSTTKAESPPKKRERSGSIEDQSTGSEKKRQKAEKDFTDETKKNVKPTSSKSNKKRGRSVSSSRDETSDEDSSDESSSSVTSSSSEEESSDDSSFKRQRKKKSHRRRHRRSKKSSRHAETSSESESESESDDGSSSESDGGRNRKTQGRSKRRHHRNKAKTSKKKRKSKHR